MSGNSPDSYSPVVSEMAVISGGVTYVITTGNFLQRITLNLAKDAVWTASIDMFDSSSQVIEDLLTARGQRGEAIFAFRWGWDGPAGIQAYEWYYANMATYELDFTTSGTQIRLNLLTAGVVQCYLDKKIRSWDAGKRIDAIFKEIANDRGWAYDGTLQECPVTLKETISRGESDVNFIKTQLCPYARDTKNNAGFTFFFDENNRAHFHNQYFDTPNKQGSVSAHYVVNRDPRGEVISFRPQDMAMFSAIMGGGNAVAQSADSKGGQRIEIVTSYIDGAPDTTNITDGSSVYKRTISGDTIHSHTTFFEREPDLIKSRVLQQYEQMKNMAYTANIVVRGTHSVSVLDTISVDVLRPDGSRHYLSGNFRVINITHLFDTSVGWSTEFSLIRAGTGYEDLFAQTQTKPDVTTTPTEGPATFIPGAPTNGPDLGNVGTTTNDAQPGGDAPRRGKV